jgi:hypothetical protein
MAGVRVMEGHADHKSASTKEDQKGRPRRNYSTHVTLTHLPSGTGCLATHQLSPRLLMRPVTTCVLAALVDEGFSRLGSTVW